MRATRRTISLGALAVAALTASVAIPSAGADSLGSTPFGIRALNSADQSFSAIKGLALEDSGSGNSGGGSPEQPSGDRTTTLVVNTALPGCTADSFELAIATKSSLAPSVALPASGTVNWGDGSSESLLKPGSNSHSYSSPGVYTVDVKGSFGGFTKSSSNSCIQSVARFGADSGMVTLEDMFNGAQNIESVAQIPSTVLNLHGMFLDAPSFSGDVSSWDTSNVEDMSLMFASSKEPSAFSSDVSSWKTGKVRDFSLMFYNAPKFNSDVSRWDVSSATTIASMFNGNSSFSSDLSSWNTSRIRDFGGLFAGATSFNSDLSRWNTSSATEMGFMFSSARSFDQDISSWDTSRVTGMDYMFYGTDSFDRDLSSWNVDKVSSKVGFNAGSKISEAHLPRWS